MKHKEDIHIEHPEVWELLVSIADKQVSYILFTPTVANSLVMGDMALIDDTLQALEDAIYDTPLLLNEYKRVTVVVHSQHFVLFPDETTDEDCKALLRHAFPGDDGQAAVCPMPVSGVKIAYLMPQGLQAFLGRTFNYPVLYHHLYPLCEHFKDLHFALKAWRSYGLDQLTDELQLMGDRESCAALSPKLREFVKYVMPAVYPAAAMRLGRNAMQAPLELILLALCE